MTPILCPECRIELIENHCRYDCPKCHRTILSEDDGEPTPQEDPGEVDEEDDENMSKYGDMNF